MLTLFLYEEEKTNKIRSKNTETISPRREFFNVALFMKSDSSSQENSIINKPLLNVKNRINRNTWSSSITWVRGHNDAACHMLYVQ